MTMVRRMAAQGLLALLVVATAAACGGGDDGSDDVATLGEQADDSSEDAGDDASGDGSGEELTDAEREDAMLEFTECMREHGVDLPDPELSGGGPGGGGGFAITNRVNGPEDAEAFEAAQEACGDILDDVMGERPQLSPEEEAEMRDNMLAFAECMRDHGIDMPDPEFGSGEAGFSIRAEAAPGGAGGGPGPDDAELQEAQEACQGELGFEDGEGPGMVFRADGPESEES
jgi:hypothetical protein